MSKERQIFQKIVGALLLAISIVMLVLAFIMPEDIDISVFSVLFLLGIYIFTSKTDWLTY